MRWLRKNFWGMAILAAVTIATVLVVRHYRQSGRMTILEAQAMDMSRMKPPVGVAPVAVETVEPQDFTASVTYTGTISPYSDQDIFPRVEGLLRGLTAYNGDRVRQGQLLATVYAPEVGAEAQAARYAGKAAQADVAMARAEIARSKAAVLAAVASRVRTESESASAEAEAEAAKEAIASAEQELVAARAESEYWRAEIRRMSSLLSTGAVSQEGYDREKAQAATADAIVAQKEANLRQSKSSASAAEKRAAAARAGVQAATEEIAAAQSDLQHAKKGLVFKRAASDQASSQAAAAAAVSSYRELRAPFAGVVTRRYVHPGTLVGPDKAVLNIAQMDRVRVQANVAEDDVGKVRLGAAVVVVSASGIRREGRVTSISPAADPASRTAVAEAVIHNEDGKFTLGAYVRVHISVEKLDNIIAVPSQAVIVRDGRSYIWIVRSGEDSGGGVVYTCPMHPEVRESKPGECPKCGMTLIPSRRERGKKGTAHLAEVKVGPSGGDRTAILSGLSRGDRVIYAGFENLNEGDPVQPVPWGEAGPKTLPLPPPTPAGGKMSHTMRM